MAGHSKWATTKHKKALIDAKRSKIFSKLANIISVAARRGDDPETNPALRDAIAKAREFNMPQENIDRAIKRGAGKIPGIMLEEFLVEAYGPEKIGLVIRLITDNKNRTMNELRSFLNEHGGSLAEAGSVLWMFTESIVFSVPRSQWQQDSDLELEIIDLGAEDIQQSEDKVIILSKKETAEKLRQFLEKQGLNPKVSYEYIANNPVSLPKEETKEKIENFLEALYAINEVEEIYTNVAL